MRELAFVVCTALLKSGTTAVLSGGGAATIYSQESYQSRDLDFVVCFFGTLDATPLTDLGFVLDGQTYTHPKSPFTLDFPQGPLMIGSQEVDEWGTFEENGQKLHIITATDSVLDRFVAYAHWNDTASLKHAALVALAIGDELDWNRIREWCDAEGITTKIDDLQREINRLRGRR